MSNRKLIDVELYAHEVILNPTWTLGSSDVALLMAEYDRRGDVERAAAAYILACLCNGGIPELVDDVNAKWRALFRRRLTNGEYIGRPVQALLFEPDQSTAIANLIALRDGE